MADVPILVITEDGSHTIYRPDLDEHYHSINGAIQESEHVFIRAGLEYWYNLHKIFPAIFEVGFGTGLNALLTNIFAKKNNLIIPYSAIEKFPLSSEIIESLNYGSKLNQEGIFNELHNNTWDQKVQVGQLTLQKYQNDYLSFDCPDTYDIIYFDAFAPSKQPEMWNYSILKKCIDALNPEGIFVTYSANGQLKRNLKLLGMIVETLPGPPGKFEMIRASF